MHSTKLIDSTPSVSIVTKLVMVTLCIFAAALVLAVTGPAAAATGVFIGALFCAVLTTTFHVQAG